MQNTGVSNIDNNAIEFLSLDIGNTLFGFLGLANQSCTYGDRETIYRKIKEIFTQTAKLAKQTIFAKKNIESFLSAALKAAIFQFFGFPVNVPTYLIFFVIKNYFKYYKSLYSKTTGTV